MEKIRMLEAQIERMKDDFEQERKGFITLLRIKEEEIDRLKSLLRGQK